MTTGRYGIPLVLGAFAILTGAGINRVQKRLHDPPRALLSHP